MNKNYICHSGGALGADITWETYGEKYGVKTIAYSFNEHNTKSKNKKILSLDTMRDAISHLDKANEQLKRGSFSSHSPYVIHLLSRNWFQVKNSDTIFAIGKLHRNKKSVNGGTGWAVQMGIDNGKPIYVYDQTTKFWYAYLYTENKFVEYYDIPTLTENFAGIGTRKLSVFGEEAIKQIYKHNFIK